MAGYLKEEGYIRLIQCFLNPALMLNRPESPNPLTGDQQVLELYVSEMGGGGEHGDFPSPEVDFPYTVPSFVPRLPDL